MLDSLTAGVLVTLLIDLVGLMAIVLGFICIRKHRGDKQTVSSTQVAAGRGPDAMIDMLFEDSIDSQRLEEQLEIESDLVRRKTIDLQWAVHEDEQLGTQSGDESDEFNDQSLSKKSQRNNTSHLHKDLKQDLYNEDDDIQSDDNVKFGLFKSKTNIGKTKLSKQLKQGLQQDFQRQIAEPLISNAHSRYDQDDVDDDEIIQDKQDGGLHESLIAKEGQIVIEDEHRLSTEEEEAQQQLEIEKLIPKLEEDEKEARKKNIKESLMRKFSIIKNALRGRQSNKNGGVKKRPHGIMDWFYILRKISDEDLKVISGTDGALYLVFQRLAAKFFAVVSVINFLIFVPVYVTGYPKDNKEIQDEQGREIILALLTVMNITDSEQKLQAVFIIMMVSYTLAAYTFMFFYWKMSADWRYRKHSHKEKFLDYDIALHSLMITNLPTEINMLSMSKRIRLVFESIFPDSKVISAKAVAKLDNLYNLALKLKGLKKEYRYYKMVNKKAEDEGKPRKTIKKRKGCFTAAIKYDAEDYFKTKIKKKLRDIQAEKERKMKINGGFGFVTFISNLQVKKCLHKNHFKTMIMDHLTQEERLSTQALQWKVRQAPAQSDIIWENMYKDDGISQVKSWFLVILLFITCVIFITPVSLVDNLKPIVDAITKDLGSDNFLSIVLTTYLSPLILLAFNFGIIPLLIDLIAFLEDHKTKSTKQLGIMRKNFFFQLFNTVVLQLTAQTTILAFLEVYSKSNWEDLPNELGQKLVNNNFFFLRYTIQLCFISNGVQLLDIPHHLIKIIKYFFHVRANKREVQPKAFVDDFAFDLGYHQSYTIVIFCMGIIFCGTMPLISIFSMLFFSIKYYVDKYNLTFVYNKEFEGGGAIKKQVLPFLLFSIYFFQILNMGYFASNYGTGYFKGGMVFITIESLALIFLNVHYSTKKKKSRDQLSSLEENIKCVNLEELEDKESEQDKVLGQDQQISDLMNKPQQERRNTVMNFVNGNLMKGTARRLTMVGHEEMSFENAKKLQDAYKHPFDKIPKNYFQWHSMSGDLEKRQSDKEKLNIRKGNQTPKERVSSNSLNSDDSQDVTYQRKIHQKKSSDGHKSINNRASLETDNVESV